MKFTADVSALKSAISTILPAIPKRTTMTALEHIHIAVEAGTVALTATDLKKSLTVFVNVWDTDAGVGAVRAEEFSALLRNLDPGEIVVSCSNITTTVTTGNAKFNIPSMNPLDLPTLDHKSTNTVALPGATFRQGLRSALFVVDKAVQDSSLGGVLIEASKQSKSIRMVGVSSTKFSAAEFSLPANVERGFSVILPADSAQTLCDSLPDDTEFELSITKQTIMAAIGDTVMVTRLIEDPFPNYRPVFENATAVSTATLNRSVMLSALKRVGIFASKQKLGRIYLKWEKGGVVLSGEDEESGKKGEERVPVESGEIEGTQSLSAFYLYDVLSNSVADEVTVWTTPKGGQLVLQSKDLVETTVVLALMRT